MIADPLLPGTTIGVFGSGQLGRMLGITARQMGYRIRCFSPDSNSPLEQIADTATIGVYEDLDAVRQFARTVDVLTFEFENVSIEAVNAAAQFVPIRPGGQVLHTTQHRLREKTFLQTHGFPVTPFRAVRSTDDLAGFSYPAILKSAGFGYDGKGQYSVQNETEAATAFSALQNQECVLEKRVAFDFEVSVVAARGLNGKFAAYEVVRNDHANHILDLTTVPADLSPTTQAQAVEITRGVLEKLDVVGVLCVEFFVMHDGLLLINELAPRPHNSGHWTIEGAETSQFEQQLRAVCGLPLGSTALRRPGAAMANLLGDLWENGEPNWAKALAVPGVHLHLYGKTEARPGRKMGHLTALADTPQEAADKVRKARAFLTTL